MEGKMEGGREGGSKCFTIGMEFFTVVVLVVWKENNVV